VESVSFIYKTRQDVLGLVVQFRPLPRPVSRVHAGAHAARTSSAHASVLRAHAGPVPPGRRPWGTACDPPAFHVHPMCNTRFTYETSIYKLATYKRRQIKHASETLFKTPQNN